jgi:hypothetical protein
MPGADDREHKIPVRRFTGTMVTLDPAFTPLGFLFYCSNWVPSLTYVLSKRYGSASWQTLPGSVGYVDRLCYNLGSDGHRYLFAMAIMASGGDTLFVSVDDGAFAAVANGTFASQGMRYGIAANGDTVYVGNDTDPLKYVHLGDTAVDVVQLALATDTGQAAACVSDPNSNIIAGTYAYRWGVFDNTASRWVALGNVRNVTTPSGSRVHLEFTPPSGGLAAGQTWHLFVAGVDQMIEGAHDQLPNGVAAGTAPIFSLYDDPTVDTTAVPIPSTVKRHGSNLVAHRGCIYGAGGVGAEANRVWCTSVLVPGLEQSVRDQGLFFPAQALTRDLGDGVTGLAVVPQTSAVAVPTAPLAIFTPFSTWMWQGDLSGDDPTANLAQISGEIGCPSGRSIASTTVGVLFCGKRSVYLLEPSAQEPRDIGWPIETAIRAIPADARNKSWAVFHRGFYKLAITPAGAAWPSEQWWLDLRHGLGDPPSWWGPHTFPAYTASVKAADHPAEDDRQWATLGAGQVLLLDQAGVYVEDGVPPVPLVSQAVTAYLDDGTPLVPKLAKRARMVARVDADTSVTVTVTGDQAASATGLLAFHTPPGADWNVADWNVAQWLVSGLDLEELELPVPEIRARAFQATLTHTDAVGIDLRDFELRVQPSARETR